MTRLLACVDASVYAASVCDHAAWAARRMGIGIDLLHVIGRSERSDLADLTGMMAPDANILLLEELAKADENYARLARERGRVLLETSRDRLREAGIDDVNTQQRSGGFVEAVCDVEETTAVVVIGKRGSSADFAKLHLGSNLERVVRACRRPVLVASRAFRPVEKVLVAFDGGPSAQKAVDFVAESPLFADLEIHLVTVGTVSDEIRMRLKDAAGRIGRAAQVEVLSGEADAAIGAYVKQNGIDFLAMGAYGHSRVRQFIVGSTTSAMIRTCLIPVMLFR